LELLLYFFVIGLRPPLLGKGYIIVEIRIFWRGSRLSKLKGNFKEAAISTSVLSSEMDEPITSRCLLLLKVVPIYSSSMI